MLGNQYFLTRNYQGALDAFLKAIKTQPASYEIRKKLVICYVSTNKVRKALNELLSIIGTNLQIITGTNIEKEDCPCQELISQFESNSIFEKDSFEHHTAFGILWLYCNPLKAIEEFNLAKLEEPDNKKIHKVLSILHSNTNAKLLIN